MPATMEAGTIHGYSVGEPWNQQAVFKGIGVPVVTDYEIWQNNPEKVFGVSKQWAEKYPNTHLRVVRAMIRAAYWLDEENNKTAKKQLVFWRVVNTSEPIKRWLRIQWLAPLNTKKATSVTSLISTSSSVITRLTLLQWCRMDADTNAPLGTNLWIQTGLLVHGHRQKVYRPDIYKQAAQSLIDDGTFKASDFPELNSSDGFKAPQKHFIDNIIFDGKQPNAYLEKFPIGLKDKDTI